MACQHTGVGHVYGIDPWSADFSLEGVHPAETIEFWGQLDYDFVYRGCLSAILNENLTDVCTLLRLSSERAEQLFDQIDLLHIDGNHDADAAVRDVRLYLPKVPPGGHIWFDDANWISTERARALLESECELVEDSGTYVWYRKRSSKSGVVCETTVEAAVALCETSAHGNGEPVRKRTRERGILMASSDTRLGDYCGGVYNPGAVAEGECLQLLARNERFSELERQRDRTLWPESCRPLAIRVDRDGRIEECQPLTLHETFQGSRAEDFRLFRDSGGLFASFSRVLAPDRIENQISAVDLSTRRLGPPQRPVLDFAVQPVEKNWCYFEHAGALHLLYSFRPFRVLRRVDGTAVHFSTVVCGQVMVEGDSHDYQRAERVSMSTSPVEFDSGRLLTFVHWRDEAKCYRHYGVLLDKTTLWPVSIAREPLFTGGGARGVHRHVVYLMSVVRVGGEFWFLLGEGDQHISYARMSASVVQEYFANARHLALREIDAAGLAGTYNYEHCGLFRRLIGLAPDGSIVGGGSHDSHWSVERDGGEFELLIYGSGRVSCRMRPDGCGVWSGVWHWGRRPVARLTPLSPEGSENTGGAV